MKRLPVVIGIAVLVATLGAIPAAARQPGNSRPAAPATLGITSGSGLFDLRPGLTQEEFQAFVDELGPMLRFRQVGDTSTLPRGAFELSVQLANTPFDDSKGAWATSHTVGRSISYPAVVARLGVSNRVDLGVMGGFDPHARYGVAGVDAKIALVRQGPGCPVSVSVRPSLATFVYPTEMLAGAAGVDLSVSHAVGSWSPYAGVGASTAGALERSDSVDLSPVSAEHTVAFVGLSYRYRTLVLSAELEKGTRYNYAVRIGKRF